jgi:anti-sigma-K factor RskA
MVQMNKCKQTQKLLADYRSGILNPRQTAAVKDHIKQCVDCANELRVLDDVLALIDSNTPQYEPPIGLWNGVNNRITAPEPRYPIFKRLMSRPLQTAGAGVAAIALAISLIVSTTRHETVQPVHVASNVQYIQGHALYAGQAPLADRVSYLSVVVASSESDKDNVK